MPVDFIEQITNEPLTYNSSSGVYTTDSSMEPSPVSEGRGWVYLDDTSSVFNNICQTTYTEQTGRVTVKNSSGDTIPQSAYTTDYVRGRLINVDTNVSGTPTTVNYFWNYVSVIEGWLAGDPPTLPVVAIDMYRSERGPFQLGGGRKGVRSGRIHIFATSAAERDDLTDLIMLSMFQRSAVIIDYSLEGEPLNYDGTYNTAFTGTIFENGVGGIMFFEDVVASKVFSRDNWSLLNRFRSTINFKIITYRDTNDPLP